MPAPQEGTELSFNNCGYRGGVSDPGYGVLRLTPTRVELPSATSVPDPPVSESETRAERETVS